MSLKQSMTILRLFQIAICKKLFNIQICHLKKMGDVDPMRGQKRIRDYAITVGRMTPGRLNAITDVKGVQVGHVTLDSGAVKTGVTAILPHKGNLFQEKVTAACHVINGFGKSAGLTQINELGTIETPIILTNTLSVGTAIEGLLDYMLLYNKDIGDHTGTVNPVIGECNDGYLNAIRERTVTRSHITEAIRNADTEFSEGVAGAGTGMSCMGLKGGIGTASRLIELSGEEYTLGALVLSNFGLGEELVINGLKAGEKIQSLLPSDSIPVDEDKGSIMIILATDIPLSERQLKRLAKRASVGLSRTGSFIGNGSGDIAIAFSTAQTVPHYAIQDLRTVQMLNEMNMDLLFKAVSETTEEAILNSLITAEKTTGRNGHVRHALKDFIDAIL